MTSTTLGLQLATWSPEGRLVKPHPRQRWVLQALASGLVDELFVFGGFGAGKTCLLAWGLVQLMLAAWREWDGKRATRPRFALISSTGAQLRQVTLPAVTSVLGAMAGYDGPWWVDDGQHHPLVRAWHRDDHTYELVFGDLTLASGHDGAQSIEGAAYVVIAADESPLYLPEALDRITRRHRQMGYSLRVRMHCATPQPGRSLHILRDRYQDLPMGRVVDRRCRVSMPTRQNLRALPPGYDKALADGVSPQMARAILEGDLVTLEGRIYSTYDEGSIMEYSYRPGSGEVVVGWDPGYRRSAIVALQRLTADSWVAFDEIMMADASTEAQAQALAGRPWVGALTTVVHDRAASSIVAAGGTSDLAILRQVLGDHGIRPRFACATNPEDTVITVGLERARAWLQSYSGRRGCYVARSLAGRRYPAGIDGKPTTGLHGALHTQTYGRGTDEPDTSDHEAHKRHASDAFRYLALWAKPVTRIDRGAYDEGAEESAKVAEVKRQEAMWRKPRVVPDPMEEVG